MFIWWKQMQEFTLFSFLPSEQVFFCQNLPCMQLNSSFDLFIFLWKRKHNKKISSNFDWKSIKTFPILLHLSLKMEKQINWVHLCTIYRDKFHIRLQRVLKERTDRLMKVDSQREIIQLENPKIFPNTKLFDSKRLQICSNFSHLFPLMRISDRSKLFSQMITLS